MSVAETLRRRGPREHIRSVESVLKNRSETFVARLWNAKELISQLALACSSLTSLHSSEFAGEG